MTNAKLDFTNDIDTLKAIAQADAMGNDYFVFGGKVWDISEQDAKEGLQEWLLKETGDYHYSDSLMIDWLDSEACELSYDEDGDYIVLTDDEADEKVEDYIRDSVWAFTPDWLASFTGFDESIFKAIQSNDMCESNNEAILSLIENNPNEEGFDEFVRQSVSSDGRGHFMSSYDGGENEFNCFEYTGSNQYLYVYRIN